MRLTSRISVITDMAMEAGGNRGRARVADIFISCSRRIYGEHNSFSGESVDDPPAPILLGFRPTLTNQGARRYFIFAPALSQSVSALCTQPSKSPAFSGKAS
ncbi:MAG: hypothetical protein JXA20_17240 [Spirochaetes bacterium]|nr:hypothetical protein [Spirochaetota bacterium]